MAYELFNFLLDFFDNIEVMGEMTNVACLNSFAPRQLMQDSVSFHSSPSFLLLLLLLVCEFYTL